MDEAGVGERREVGVSKRESDAPTSSDKCVPQFGDAGSLAVRLLEREVVGEVDDRRRCGRLEPPEDPPIPRIRQQRRRVVARG